MQLSNLLVSSGWTEWSLRPVKRCYGNNHWHWPMGSHLSLIHTGGGMTEAPIKRLFFLFCSFDHICDLCGYLQNKPWQIIILMYLLYVQYASRIVHTVQQMWHKRRCSDVIPSGCTLGGTHTWPQCDHRSWAHLFVPLCVCVNAHTQGRVCSANMPLAVMCVILNPTQEAAWVRRPC